MKLVKICGIKRQQAASEAISFGADLLGMIMVPGRARTIDIEEAKAVAQLVKQTRQHKKRQFQTMTEILNVLREEDFETIDDYSDRISDLLEENGPFLVGVFRNQPMTDVFRISEEVGNDIIQLHGKENVLEYCSYNSKNFDSKFGVIPRFVIPNDVSKIYDTLEAICIGGKYFGNGFLLPLLDSELGGEGKLIDWSLLKELTSGKFILAGGLNEFNILQLSEYSNLKGFDVSGGVETQGEKDPRKVENFIKNGKSVA
ncbi:bifunctional tryptophan synthase trp1 [Yamadazyma tenuis]|uniref:N-(5'-phosphoribosyl)anthranilate isomerase n=1 Tax=Candida tenuis (strain ATCC 10573 / BCRC 21748 / CBS 615 / JCM 9827 / NBRC 10315 / NRRL Y-1498 / VKM Y-70) TaxID=590646 RepID=G3B725_CANTC|nr:uncharacterized protein CANTEDRAFT_114390 [Yamadazyma tenuis ATCC 10573]XP_006687332.1 uncharacterized protein CANTEDRAFT_114390 [Yamadazyma tenuis ATCC 10573]EGV63538.1 hypothetical protein CANTEDRAFT_114390 [Yamadazyma tenuis ATCC 10573]EGV63539.1 hypothetical protein CANTEDRAFT_114390 [Yamadazyma tenuis ATCC 10573]WEJ97104.1 bifunctional tryptophan synthase trp1 [Yamadazyma tenuis]